MKHIDLNSTQSLNEEQKVSLSNAIQTFIDYKKQEAVVKALEDKAKEAKQVICDLTCKALNVNANQSFDVLFTGSVNYQVKCSISKAGLYVADDVAKSITELQALLEQLRAEPTKQIIKTNPRVTLSATIVTSQS